MEEFYRQYGPLVMRRCRHLLKDPLEAQDAVQEIFLKVLNQPRWMRVEFPSSLLYTMATHHCLNRLRHRKRNPENREEAFIDALAAQDDLESQSSAGRLLDRLFHRFPASTRVMAVLHYIDGLTLEEVAKETSLSVSGVRKRLRGLRETLQQWEEKSHVQNQVV